MKSLCLLFPLFAVGCAASNAPVTTSSTTVTTAVQTQPEAHTLPSWTSPPTKPADPNTVAASTTQTKIYEAAKRLVKARLHKPSQARFSDINTEDTSIEKQDDGAWVVHAYVDAPNRDGKILHTPFVLECKFISGKVKPTALDIADGPGDFEIANSPVGDPLAMHQ